MEQAILIVHVLAALAIIGLIMIQQGKGADMGASFGAGGSQTLFGGTGGGNALTKATALLAALFFATSFGLAVVAKNKAVVAGNVGVPVPMVVESKDMPQVPVTGGEIPELDEAAIQQAMETQPEAVVPEDFDIPTSAGTPAASGSSASGGDIPEM